MCADVTVEVKSGPAGRSANQEAGLSPGLSAPRSDSDDEFDDADTEKKLLISGPSPSLDLPREEYAVGQYGSIQGERQRQPSVLSYSTDYERAASQSDSLRIFQAQVFIEDAEKYRSVDHKLDKQSLLWYRLYHSKAISLLRYFVITLLHMLAFFEFPSSLSWTSDLRKSGRVELPCGFTEGIEFVCLIFLLGDVSVKAKVYGRHHIRSNKWLLLEIFILGVSFIDWTASIALGCREVVRVRRMLRPVFIIQNSSLMKKILNSLRKTLSQILGVLMLMALHLYVFTLFGMLMFPQPSKMNATIIVANTSDNHTTGNNTQGGSESEYFRTLADSFMSLLILLTTANNPDVTLPAYTRNRFYSLFFILFLIIGLYCFMNMLTAIIYNQFRGYFLSSMQSSLMRRRLGQRAAFETLKKKTLQMGPSIHEETEYSPDTSKVSVRDLKHVLASSSISRQSQVVLIESIAECFTQDQLLTWNQFLSILHMTEKSTQETEKPRIRWLTNYPWVVMLQKLVCHRYFTYLGNFMALVNVILITIELETGYDKSMNSSKSVLRVINFLFILYYAVEQSTLVVCLGWRRYTYSRAHVVDGLIVLILLISEIVTVALYGFPFFSERQVYGNLTLWNFVRVINILIMIRLLRVIWHFKTMAIVAHTLLDLVKNMQSFGGILIVIYYFYAILGMELFYNKISYDSDIANKSMQVCGTYEQLEYWANNFNDFAAAVVVLWDVMVVNNWFVFLDAYSKYTNQWSYLYFIVWWLLSVVIALNLFTALILEVYLQSNNLAPDQAPTLWGDLRTYCLQNFIMKWDRYYERQTGESRDRLGSSINMTSMNTLTVHDMFRPEQLVNPNGDYRSEKPSSSKWTEDSMK